MGNVHIRVADLGEDIDFAKKIIEGKITTLRDKFNDYSMVYRTTNENINHKPYIDALTDKETVLSITSSGDQIINSVLLGGKTIKGIDICRFTKYFVSLKIAAIKSLSRDEFTTYILGNREYPSLNTEYYERVREYLPIESLFFWDSIFKRYSYKQVNDSSFFGDFNVAKSRMIINNPYLEKDNYKITKDKLDKVDIELYDGNIFEIKKDKLQKYDLILLSNVINYINDFDTSFKPQSRKYKSFLKKLPLKDDGIALTYNFIFSGSLEKKFNSGDYKTYKVREELDYLDIENEIMIYKKRKSLFRR